MRGMEAAGYRDLLLPQVSALKDEDPFEARHLQGREIFVAP